MFWVEKEQKFAETLLGIKSVQVQQEGLLVCSQLCSGDGAVTAFLTARLGHGTENKDFCDQLYINTLNHSKMKVNKDSKAAPCALRYQTTALPEAIHRAMAKSYKPSPAALTHHLPSARLELL